MDIDYRHPLFYGGEYREQFEITERVKVDTLPTLGKVKGYYEVHMFNDGYIGVYNNKRDRYLKPIIGSKKSYYFRYGLKTVEGKTKTTYMHRLVGLSWVSGWNKDKITNHIDFDQLNNLASNLEWVSVEENSKHAKENGAIIGGTVAKEKIPKLSELSRSMVYSSGKENGGLTYGKVQSVFELNEDGYSRTLIGKELGVSQPCVSQILLGLRWKTHPASIEYFRNKNIDGDMKADIS